ncbi:MAG: hypothetical protein N2249_06215 [Melioribacter sp.]|nr:hypothetical protein [Melioribacter sp.]
MIKIQIFTIVFFLNVAVFFAQQSDYEKVKREYDSFEYENVIKFSDELVKKKNLPDSLLIDVYLMRAVSFYSLGMEDSTKENFKDILRIKSNYQADPSKISPKLITLFEQVKVNFMSELKLQASLPDTLRSQLTQKSFDYRLASNSFLRNIILPGAGQIYSGIKTKGIMLGIISVFNLAGMIYYINDTNKKEKDYLNEFDPLLIQRKYDLYNKSYKIRNALIISYAIVWLYSQLDLLFFSNDDIFIKTVEDRVTEARISTEGLYFTIKLPLNF